MTSQYRHRRTSNPATAFPNPIEPGEIAVNTANRQLVVGDAASGVAGVPLALLALRFFDTRAIYAAGDMVYQAGVVYRAKAACGPESFNPAHWDILAGTIDPLYVQKAGDTMTGALHLPAAMPTVADQAAHKAYVDLGLDGKSVVLASTTAPAVAGYPDNTLWYESDSGTLFLLYNDGDSRQWVIASPQPDPATFVAKAGDTMFGYLVLNADPVTPLGAATAQYTVSIAAAAANTRVAKTGDIMTGALENPTVPTLNQHVVNKLYVDQQVNAKSSTIIADSPPPGAPDGTIWYESDSGLAYVRYNDGNSSQWVALLSIAGNAVLFGPQTLTAPQKAQATTNIGAVAKIGDTMTGDLNAPRFNVSGAGGCFNIADRLGVTGNNWVFYATSGALRWFSPNGDMMTLSPDYGDLQWNGAPWTAYTPTVTVAGGAGTATGRYKRLGKTCAVSFTVTVTAGGSLTNVLLPVQAGAAQCMLMGRENALTGYVWQGLVTGSTTTVSMYNYINQNGVSTNASVIMSGVYETV